VPAGVGGGGPFKSRCPRQSSIEYENENQKKTEFHENTPLVFLFMEFPLYIVEKLYVNLPAGPQETCTWVDTVIGKPSTTADTLNTKISAE